MGLTFKGGVEEKSADLAVLACGQQQGAVRLQAVARSNRVRAC